MIRRHADNKKEILIARIRGCQGFKVARATPTGPKSAKSRP
jgi:hypothetical protein